MWLNTLLAHPHWDSVVPALLHTLWIGILAAAGLGLAIRTVSVKRATLRYGLAVVALGIVLVGGVLTWAAQDRLAEIKQVQTSGPIETLASAHAASSQSPSKEAVMQASRSGLDEGENAPAVLSFAWQSILAGVWCLGVALMLIRFVAALTGTHRLRFTALPIDHESPIHVIAIQMGQALALGSRVLVLASDRLHVPAVIGVVRPTLLWPVSWLTGLPEWQIRAILAHELAHIRRHDYLFNVLQMMVETLLFFNPAVWWISRQIRIEREACCDAMATELLDDQDDLVHTLAEVANRWARPCLPECAVAFSDHPTGLLDRVRRLIEPAYRPIVRVPWLTLILMLTIVIATVAGLKKTGDLVARAVMPDKERIERMAELTETYGKPEIEERVYGEADRVGLAFQIQTHDGQPLPEDMRLVVRYERGRHSGTSSYSLSGWRGVQFNEARTVCTVESRVEFGKIRIGITVPGYAPFISEPLLPEPGGEADFGLITMHAGFQAILAVRNTAGDALADVEVKGRYGGNPSAGSFTLHTDAMGLIRLDHAAAYPLELEAVKDGYARVRKRFDPMPGQTHEWILASAEVASGQVLDKHTGDPIEQAKIVMIGELTNGGTISHSHDQASSHLASTDETGHFDLTSLHPQARYVLVAMAPGYCPQIMDSVFAGQQGILFLLDAAITIRGKVINIPQDQLDKKGRVGVYFRHRVNLSERFNDILYPREPLRSEPLDGIVNFEIDSVWPVVLEIDVAGVGIEIKQPHSTDNLVIDWAALQAKRESELTSAEGSAETLPDRDVVIRLVPPKGSPLPTGTLTVEYIRFESNPHYEKGLARISQTKEMPVDAHGTVRFKLKTPNTLELSAKGLEGYTFDQQWYFDGKFQRSRAKIETAQVPFEATLALKPAGSIYGRVLESDGSPGHSLMISLSPSEGIDIKSSARGKDDTQNRFHAGPLALDRAYCIVAHRTDTYLVSEPVTLTAAEPFREIEMRFPQTHTLEVEVVDESGDPVPNMPVSLSFTAAQGHSFGRSPSPQTDSHGLVRFQEVIKQEAEGSLYTLNLEPDHDYQPQVQRLATFDPGQRVRFVAHRGQVLEGRLIDTVTGKPMPQARVYAMPAWDNWMQDTTRYTSYIDADSETDENGRFRFSRLCQGLYRLGTSSGREAGNHAVMPGQTQNVELRAKAADSYRQKHLKE